MRRLIAVIFILGSLLIVGTIFMKKNSGTNETRDGSRGTEVVSGEARSGEHGQTGGGSSGGSSDNKSGDTGGAAPVSQPVEPSSGTPEATAGSQGEGAPASQAGAPAASAAVNKFGAPPSIPSSSQPDVKHAPGASSENGQDPVVSVKNNAASVAVGAFQAPKDSGRAPTGANLNAAGYSSSGAGAPFGKQVATVTPNKTNAPHPQISVPVPAVPPEKPHPNFPGIDQKENILMVSDVHNKEGEGEDTITVTLSRTDGSGEISGDVWVIGEYVQRGTTGVMFMPSPNDLKLGSDGKPKNPKAGVPFQMRTMVEKKMTIRRPGFDGEELVAVRVGVVNSASGEIHMARISTRQMTKKAAIKRAKVTTMP